MATTIEVKAKSKSGKGIMDAQKNWYNVGKGVTFDTVKKGDILNLELDETGRFVLSFSSTEKPASTNEKTSASVTYDNQYSEVQARRDEGQREGNRRNVSAILAQGLTMAHSYSVEETINVYNKIHEVLVRQDSTT